MPRLVHPFDSYPQELCVRLTLSFVSEQEGVGNVSSIRTFLPDDDVIEDLCSVLSMISRRLITRGAKTRERFQSRDNPALDSYLSDIPLPVMSPQAIAAWKKRPWTVLVDRDSQQAFDHDPPPVGVDHTLLAAFLVNLPTAKNAKEIVYASRLYRTALELIETRPEIAYQLLISVVECLSGAALPSYDPGDDAKVIIKQPVYERARANGLTDTQARDLAILACKGMQWTKQKFIRFLMDRVSPQDLTAKDPLFILHEHQCPSPNGVEKALKAIYDARSTSLHAGGEGFPETVGLGTSPRIHFRQMRLQPYGPKDVPPVTWFDRVVSLAARKFVHDQTGLPGCPFAG